MQTRHICSKKELGPLLYLSDIKTYDAFARMENMDTIKQLAVPKSSRLLGRMNMVVPPDSSTQTGRQKPAPPSALNENVKGETSFRRLSDVLHPGQNSIGGNKGPWLVAFNDVVLQWKRTGITSFPLSTTRAASKGQVCYHRKQRDACQTPESSLIY